MKLKMKTKPAAGRKIAQIMSAARYLFLEHGYSVTSMDGIAERAGVSKATLYSYHDSKETLFAAIVQNLLDRASPEIIKESTGEKDILTSLTKMGESVTSMMLVQDDVAAHRMVVAEAARSPALGELYYEVGPLRLLAHLSHILKRAMDAGQLRRADPDRAAEHFVGLVIGNLHLKALLCVKKRTSAQVRRSVIQSGVEAFYRAYRPEKSKASTPKS